MPEIINVTGEDIDMLFCPDIDEDWCDRTCRNCIYSNIVTIHPYELYIEFEPIQKHIEYKKGIELLTLEWKPNKETENEFDKLENELSEINENFIIVGSLEMARAYPERIYSPILAPGRQDLIRGDMFNVFLKEDENE